MQARTHGEVAPEARAAVEHAARAARANRAAVWGLGFQHGLRFCAGAGMDRLAAAAAGAPVPVEVAAVQAAARARGLPPCAATAEAGFRAAVRAVVHRVRELDRAG